MTFMSSNVNFIQVGEGSESYGEPEVAMTTTDSPIEETPGKNPMSEAFRQIIRISGKDLVKRTRLYLQHLRGAHESAFIVFHRNEPQAALVSAPYLFSLMQITMDSLNAVEKLRTEEGVAKELFDAKAEIRRLNDELVQAQKEIESLEDELEGGEDDADR